MVVRVGRVVMVVRVGRGLRSAVIRSEIPTVPIYYLAKPQPRERTWEEQRGKKTLLSLTLVSYCGGASLA